MADEFDDDELDMDDDEDIDDDVDDDELLEGADDDDEDEEEADDEEEITADDAFAYAKHVEEERDKLAAENRILERTLKREAKAKQKPAKPTPDEIIDREFEAGGRDADEPFKI